MLEVFRRKRRFYLVFEFMDHTLLEELEERSSSSSPGLGEATVRRHAFQILRGLDFCHASNVKLSFCLKKYQIYKHLCVRR
jgi:cyclin-dependent kinase-like